MNVKKQLIQDNQVFQLGFYMTLFRNRPRPLMDRDFQVYKCRSSCYQVFNRESSLIVLDIRCVQRAKCFVFGGHHRDCVGDSSASFSESEST